MRLRLDSFYSRIACVFALVLIAFGAALGWLAYAAAKYHQHDVMQQLSRNLAQHITSHESLMSADGVDRKAVEALFDMTMAVNPSIEIYLLDADGAILAHSPPEGALAVPQVSLEPIHAFLAGRSLPILGDSPRNATRKDVFSVAPITHDGRAVGYLYIVLLGDMYRQMAEDARRDYVLHTALWVGAAALAMALIAGLTAFGWITRPLNKLTLVDKTSRTSETPVATDEITRLALAFEHMTDRLAAQMAELRRQDDLRRELVAKISHDLRTPLTSMQNYLETLSRMGESLSAIERQQYLEVAVRQSHRVTKLAQ